jgi:hypothetical protein
MEEAEILAALKSLEKDPAFITKSAYRANAVLWPNHHISFVDTHLMYLKARPALNPQHYIANLKLMLRKKV